MLNTIKSEINNSRLEHLRLYAHGQIWLKVWTGSGSNPCYGFNVGFVVLKPHLARLNIVQEELFYYPPGQHWLRCPQMVKFYI